MLIAFPREFLQHSQIDSLLFYMQKLKIVTSTRCRNDET